MEPKDLLPQHIAEAMGLSVEEVWSLARNRERHFNAPRQQQIGNKVRLLDVPKPRYKKLLKELHKFLQREIRFPRSAHGGVKGRSCVTSARVHQGRASVITRDVTDCFPSVPEGAFYRLLRKLGMRRDTARLLTLLMTVRDRIPQGSPVSNDALNLYFWASDVKLRREAGRLGGKVSRVADDIVVSTNQTASRQPLADLVEAEVLGLGLTISERKKAAKGLQSRGQPQLVHSLEVNRGRGLAVSREHRQQALALGESYVRSARCVTPDNLEALARKRARVTGYLHYSRQVEHGPAKQLRRLLAAGDRHVERGLCRAGLAAQRKKWWVTNKKNNRCRKLAQTWRRKHQHSGREDDTSPGNHAPTSCVP